MRKVKVEKKKKKTLSKQCLYERIRANVEPYLIEDLGGPFIGGTGSEGKFNSQRHIVSAEAEG